MNKEQFNEQARDPVTDDPNFDFKHWVLNAVNTKPYWPLGLYPRHSSEITARQLQQNVGEWVPAWNIQTVPRSWVNWVVCLCRDRYGMVIEEKTFSDGTRYRWSGTYLGNIDDRVMSEQMRKEEQESPPIAG